MQNPVDIQPVCTERYVVFLDLLGFKYEVVQAENDPRRWPRVQEALHLVKDTLCETPEVDMRLTSFSDCIVMSAARTALGLSEVIASVEMLTFNLLQHDFLVRGGFTAGSAHHDRDFVFGTAVNRAYLLESDTEKGARHPMVLVSPEVMDDVKGHGKACVACFQEDGPERWFVHFFMRYAAYTHEPIYSGKVIMDDPAQRIRDFVCHRLRHDHGRVLEKAEWLAAYWNRAVASHGVFGEVNSSIEPADTSRGPTIMMRRLFKSAASVDQTAASA